MPLQPDVAAILAAMPASPPIGSVSLSEFRARINARTAAAPRHDVPLASVEDRAVDGAPTLPVRIYTPEGSGPFPLIVYYHGGGFVIGDLNVADPICRAIASGASCVVVSVDYRLAPEHPYPAPNDDAWRALRWARQAAARFNADPGRLAVMGDSAGANLSVSMTLRARDAGLPLAAQILLYPSPAFDASAASFREHRDAPLLTLEDILFYWDQYVPDPADRRNPDAAGLLAGHHADLPPAFIATAELDPSRDQGELYAEKLREAGVEVFARRYAGMPHGFYAWVAHAPSVKAAMAELVAWTKARLATGTAA